MRASHMAHKQQSWQGAQVVDSPERQPLGLTRVGVEEMGKERRVGWKGP